MSSDVVSVRVEDLSKCYQLYDAPRDRLKQFVLPRLQRATGQPPRTYYHEFWALRDTSFEVKKGETVGIVGRNGSGKSTLLQLICGTLSPTTGTVEVNGRVAALLELGSGFNPEFTGRENVYVNGSVLGLTKKEMNARFDDIVRFADIGDFIDQPLKTYSSGMSVRLAFAVISHVDADVLVVDEALAVGDSRFQKKCIDHINGLKSRGTTVLFVSHAPEQVKRFCDRALWLNRGRIMAIGTSPAVCDQYEAFNDAQDQDVPDRHSALRSNAGKLAKINRLEMACSEISPFDRFGVEIEYEVYEDSIDSFLVGISIRRQSDNLYIFGPNTSLDNVEVPNKRGTHHVRYEIPSLPLLGGTYYVEAGLFTDNGLVCLDYLPIARVFEVRADYFCEGLVHFEHKWTVTPDD